MDGNILPCRRSRGGGRPRASAGAQPRLPATADGAGAAGSARQSAGAAPGHAAREAALARAGRAAPSSLASAPRGGRATAQAVLLCLLAGYVSVFVLFGGGGGGDRALRGIATAGAGVAGAVGAIWRRRRHRGWCPLAVIAVFFVWCVQPVLGEGTPIPRSATAAAATGTAAVAMAAAGTATATAVAAWTWQKPGSKCMTSQARRNSDFQRALESPEILKKAGVYASVTAAAAAAIARLQRPVGGLRRAATAYSCAAHMAAPAPARMQTAVATDVAAASCSRSPSRPRVVF
eukprot:COSAG01_NODE_615_length_14818_cov_9.454039_16_plen_291_part_00